MGLRRSLLPALPAATARWREASFRTRIVLPVVVFLLIVGVVPVTLLAARPSIDIRGLSGNANVSKAELGNLRVRVAAEGVQAGDLKVRMDGQPVRARHTGDTLTVALTGLTDGRHTLSVSAQSLFGLARVDTERRFTVDTRAPELKVQAQAWASSFTKPFALEGKVTEGAKVTASGTPLRTQGGKFRVRVQSPPSTVRLTATDPAGNTANATVSVGVEHPGMRAVHMTASAWSSDALREPILKMARQGKIDTVELDIKDESGQVGYESQVKLAQKIGAAKGYYDAKKAIKTLHDLGVRVVGRLVCFLDPVLAEASWKSGHKDRVIQTPGGQPYSGGYGSYTFTNFAHPAVREYNIDLAVEAAKLGFDGILYDYIRRPDGYRDEMKFPKLEGSPSKSIAEFVEVSAEKIHAQGTFVGVSVFGIAATRPDAVAQDIPAMAEHADYIAPMVYPSHWGPGEYGVANPNSQPYAIVKRSLKDFKKQVRGTGAVIIPWLQDFSLGASYGADEVSAQIEAAADVGLDSFLLWNASASYTPSAL